jgi:ribosome-associated translation inhibitor RaiA
MATTSTHFVHVDRAQHLDTFVREKIEDVVTSFKNNGKYSLEIWISKVRGETEFRGPCFKCEACLKVNGGGSPITVTKKNDSFYAAVEGVGLAMKNALTKRSRCKGREEHRQYERLNTQDHEL